MAFLQRY